MTTTKLGKRRRYLAAGVAVVLGLLAAVGIYAASGGEAPPQRPPASGQPPAPTLAVTGTVTLRGLDGVGYTKGAHNAAGNTCWGVDGFADMDEGTEVTVSAAGRVLALGRLGLGFGQADYSCVFRFEVAGIPSGFGLYEVKVGNRGGHTYEESELAAPLEFTLR